MGLLLRPDVYYAESADGAYMLTNKGPLAFTGSSVFQLIDRLAPYLNGRHTLAELTENLSAERTEQVQRLIRTLGDQGVVRQAEAAPQVYDGEYHHEVSFIDYYLDGAAKRFEMYRDLRALIVGAGGQVVPLAVAALRSGLRRVVVATTDEAPTDPGLLDRRAADARRDAMQRFDTLRLDGLNARGVAAQVAGADLVFHVSDRPMARRARLLESLCGDAGAVLAQAMPWAGEVWLSVTGPGAPAGSGWTSGLRRLAARHRAETGTGTGADTGTDAGADADEGTDADRAVPSPFGETCSVLSANRLVHQVFLEVTGVSTAGSCRMIRIDPATLRSDTHEFLPHPFCRQAGLSGEAASRTGGGNGRSEPPHPASAEDSESLRPLDPEEFSQRAAACAGDRLGLFGMPAERRFTQLPLQVCIMEVADPVGLAGSMVQVAGAGLDFAAACHDAALRAFAMHASLMVDPRRLLNSAGDPLVDADGDPDEALVALRAGRLVGHVRAYGLDGEPAGLIEATRVFPVLRGRAEGGRGSAGRILVSAGTVAACSRREAVEAGLLAQCRRLALADLAAGGGEVRLIPVDRVELDQVGMRYRAIAEAIGGQGPTLRDVTGRLGIPTVICQVGSGTGAAAGRSFAAAVRDAMGQAILRHQAVVNDEPGYAPPPVPHFPAVLPDQAVLPDPEAAQRPSVAAGGGPVDTAALDRPPVDLAYLTRALCRRGAAPCAIPLDHDQEVTAAMPYVVSVELGHV